MQQLASVTREFSTAPIENSFDAFQESIKSNPTSKHLVISGVNNSCMKKVWRPTKGEFVEIVLRTRAPHAKSGALCQENRMRLNALKLLSMILNDFKSFG